MTRFVGVILVATLVASCDGWTQVGYGPEHRRNNTRERAITSDNVANLTQAWSTSLDGGVSEPILDDGRVYVGHSRISATSLVYGAVALDAASGGELWRRERSYPSVPDPQVAGATTTGTALSAGSLWQSGFTAFRVVARGGCLAENLELNPDDGTVTSSNTSGFRSTLVTSGDVVAYTVAAPAADCPFSSEYFGPRMLVVADADTLATRWTYTFDTTIWPGVLLPTIAEGRVFVSVGSNVYGFTLAGCGASTCEPLWTADLGIEQEHSLPLADDHGRIYVPTPNGIVHVLSASTGAELGLIGVAGRSEPDLALRGDTLFATSAGPTVGVTLEAFDTNACATGSCVAEWTAYPASPNSWSEPTIAGDVVYIGGGGVVFAYDADGCGGASSCTPLVQLPLDRPFYDDLRISVGQGRLAVTGSETTEGATTSRITVFRLD